MPEPCLNLPEKHHKTLLFLLKAITPGAQVLAFGSRVSGGAQALSDIDLVLRNPIDPRQPVDGLERLRSALQESNLPYLVDLHDWSRLPEAFKQTIEAQHLIIQAGSCEN